MIRVSYECDETGQRMEIIIAADMPEEHDEEGETKAQVNIKFTPTITEDSKDPFGIMMKVLKAATNGQAKL